MTTIGRPREFDRDVALARAMQLFWRQGYEATGIQQLVRHTGVSRQSLYNTFGDKRSLFKQAIRHYRHHVQQALLDCLVRPGSGLDAIRKTLDLVVDGLGGPRCSGCLVTHTAVELAGSDKEIRRLVRFWIRELRAAFRAALDRAAAAGEIQPGRDTEALASYLVSSVQGLVVMGKTSSRETLHGIVASILSALK